MYEILSAEYIEMNWIKVVYKDQDGGVVTEYFEDLEEIALKYQEDDAEDIEELLWAE